jgi:ribonuclease P protein component
VVPRYKHSAVDRNRLKRRLRELSRLRLIPTDLAADVVLRIRPDAYDASFEALAADVERALVQLTRWRPTAAEPPADTVSEGEVDSVTNPGPAA